ncbi:aromatic compound dioxygenase, partial [Testicularia cyperi]
GSAATVLAHPGHHDEHDAQSLLQRRGERRQEMINTLRAQKRHAKAARAAAEKRSAANCKRQSGSAPGGAEASAFTNETLATSHHSNRTDITANSTSSDIFGSTTDSSACILQPEATIGPYWVDGEYVRDDISEDQEGVELHMSVQFLDVNTCEPVTDLYWEAWHCNATGVYSGVVASGNGNTDDTTNLNNTFLRGMTKTDDLGVATLKSIVPGHYTGRTSHVHVIGHTNVTVLANGTIGTGTGDDATNTAVHIGQLFFDQDLLTEVETTAPYNTNTQEVTTNSEDSIFAGETTDDSPDPVFNYVYLGDDVSDGLFAWLTIGVNATASYTTSAASTYYEEGGIA